MAKEFKYIVLIFVLLGSLVALSGYSQQSGDRTSLNSRSSSQRHAKKQNEPEQTTGRRDTIKGLKFPVKQTEAVTYEDLQEKSVVDLKDPANMSSTVEYDPATGYYIFHNRVGDMDIATPFVMSEDEYRNHALQQSMNKYWAEKAKTNTDGGNKFSLSDIQIGLGKKGEDIFGPGGVKLKTQGSVDLDFGFTISKRDNPSISEENRINTIFDFDTKIQLSATGSVGEKINFNMNYNTEATFDADQSLINLGYKGDEDDIVQRVEAGNVSLPLSSSLITGSTDLFGFRTDLQFGKLKVSGIISQQESERKTISTEGAQTTKFELVPTNYEENKHFFLASYFYDHYDEWAKNAPNPLSGIVINKVEVWVTNSSTSSANYTTRNIIALTELGESYNEDGKTTDIPYNNNGNLYKTLSNNQELRNIQSASFALENTEINGKKLEPSRDYEILNNARLLSETEYTLNSQLGYISLKSTSSSDQIVAVAFEYTKGGKTYKVGELSTATTDTSKTSSQNLLVKLIKSSIPAPNNKKLWNLSMRNVYSLNAYNVQQDNFKVEIKYYFQSDSLTNYLTYIPSLSTKNLLQVLNMDRLNKRQNAMPDGYFDFIPGYTIIPSTGRIIFLSTRPFDTGIKNGYGNVSNIEKYTFPELYDSTLTVAEQYTEKNKYIITGEYSSSSGSEIRLGVTNIARGSVRVTAGGRTLTEGTGYTVDYNLGIVKILDETALASNSPINVSVESESFFNTQRKSLIGANAEYTFSDKFSMGATILHLNEKPLTQKVEFGNEPLSNTIWGMNSTFKSDWQWLTNAIDKLPLINAKAPSSIAFSGEFAQLIPGHNKSINQDESKAGVSYIDDFEGTESSINIKNPSSWALASTPKISDGPLYKKHFIRENDAYWRNHLDPIDLVNIGYGLNRSHLAWYYIDQLFTTPNSNTPKHIKADKDNQLSHHYVRMVTEQEIYQDKEESTLEPSTLQTLHLHYYPKERGPYNLDVDKMDNNGYLENPENRWAGIMRKLDNTNFENSNIEYIEMWIMDPFKYNDMNTTSGQLVFNLGSISEDVLKDGRKAFENGLPTSQNQTMIDSTIWGRVPRLTAVTGSFDNSNLEQQDLGLDGLSDNDEFTYIKSYRRYQQAINEKVNQSAKSRWANSPFSPLTDPAGDNFHYYRGSDYDDMEASIFDRYKYYNGTEGNATSNKNENYTSTATTTPDCEDLNKDNTLNETEQYFEYIINIDRESFENENNWEDNYITNMVESDVVLRNNETDKIKWYQLRIPIKTSKRRAEGNITDFRSIRYIRMYLTGFEEEEHLRFGELQLVRTDWRVYEKNERLVESSIANKLQGTGHINISSVCIENDSHKRPVAYQLPPGIDRTIDPSQTQSRKENEQAMVLRVDSLEPNDIRAVYKTTSIDARQYKRFKMFVHAEQLIDGEYIPDNRIYAFVRFGSDFTENYYEYRIPLKITPEGSIDKYIVWPEENNFDFAFEQLVNLKLERDKKKNAGQVKFNERYTKMDGNNTMAVIGSPSFGELTSLMIGIVNEDDVAHNAEIWVNEMRMSGFDEDGGWAAVANLGIVFSDLGSLTIGGQIETTGFGNIEDNVADRNQDDFYEYNITAAIQLGKLFPEKAKVNMPFTYTRTHQLTSPKYDPLNTDTELEKTLDNYDSEAIKDSIKEMSRTDKVYQSYALNNVRVGITSKNKKYTMPYDPANFSFSLGYNETKETNPDIEYEKIKNYKGTFNYIYSINPKPVEPFKKVKWLKSNHLKLIKDFNFYYIPKNISFSTSMTRYYEETQNRSFNSPIIKDTTFQYMSFDKNWQWDRTSNIKWDLTKSLKLSFSTAMNSEIAEIISTDDEDGNRLVNIPINKEYLREIGYYDWYEKWKDTVWSSIKGFGDPVAYEQKFSATYAIPINKLPHLDWITSNAQYSADYQWDKGAILSLGSAPVTGNLIENQRHWSGDVRFNFETLYNKFPYLKEVNRKLQKPTNSLRKNDEASKDKQKDNKPKVYERKKLRLKANNKTRINHRLNSTKLIVSLKDTSGADVAFKYNVIDPNSINITTKADYNNLVLTINNNSREDNAFDKIRDYSVRFLMMVRNFNINYRHTDALELNGYKPASGFLGQDQDNPGYDFTFGFYNVENFLQRVYNEDSLLIMNENITNPIVHTTTQTLTVKSLVEPIPGLKIDVNASWYKSNQDNIYYMYGYSNGGWNSTDVAGNFSRTCLPIRTAFKGRSLDSKIFEKFLQNRNVIQQRIYSKVGYQNPNGKPNYVNKSSADVLIPAFYAAYMDRDVNTTSLNFIPEGNVKGILTALIPNWKVTCDALMKINSIKKKFKSFNLNHTYKSTYNIGNYESLTDWNHLYGSEYGINGENEEFNYITSKYDVNSVSISEQFSPLFGVDASLKSSLSFKFELKKSRTIQLDIPGNQILESNSIEYVIGSGYRFDDIGMIIKIGKSQKKVKNDLNLRGDISFKNTDAYIRVIDDEYSQLSSGLRSLSLKLSADYVLSERLNVKLYYDCKSSTPKVSDGFPTTTSDFGIAFKINLTR